MTELYSDNVRLVSTTAALLDLEDASVEQLATALGTSKPPSWPPLYNDVETRRWVRDRLRADPDHSEWYSWYIVASFDGVAVLAGTCGYKGRPDAEGSVEVGYSVVPELQRRGIASSSLQLLCTRAFALGAASVVAHTLPDLVASQRLLERTGFKRVSTISDPEEGEVWRYQLLKSKATT